MIGIFDSGSGGLTVLKALRQELPSADIVYFGDTANAPYGGKSRKELTRLTVAALEQLRTAGAEHIVSACNSVSASLAIPLFDTLLIEPGSLIEMAGPTIAAFHGSSARILLIATEATVRSEIYQNGFRMIGKDIETLAIPELAGAIERGASAEELEKIVSATCEQARGEHDIIVLACTHYPLVRATFEKVFSGVTLFDPAAAVAKRAKKLWWPQEVGDSSLRFLVSRDSDVFRACVGTLFPNESYTIEVIQ